MTLDGNGFERAIVKHCSPTLVGIKPACLFNVPGDFAQHGKQQSTGEQDHSRQAPGTRGTSGQSTDKQEPSRLRNARLDALVARANRQLAGTSVHVRVLARRSCGALVLVYRPQLLARELSAPRAAATMFSWGYETTGSGWLEAAIAHLGRKLENRQRCSANGGFPHEVGLFLGYPYDDVMAFIEHEGRDYLCCGCWKVYSDQESAEACFARYKRCTKDCEAMLGRGATLAELTSVTVAA